MPDPKKSDEKIDDAKPAPSASSPKPVPPAGEDPNKPDPTRFGDWEINGRCIDF